VTNILLVDDDGELVALLREYLTDAGFAVTAAFDGATGISEALSGRHTIAVLDIMMPCVGGLDALRQIRRESALPILMLTARGDDADCVAALELGADDYVTKPCRPGTLAARLRAILRRALPDSEQSRTGGAMRNGPLTIFSQQRRAEWQGQPLTLTSTEFSILELLLLRTGHPVTRSELSEHALGRPLGRHDRSIDVHLSSVRRRLGALPDGRSRIQTVYRRGYQLVRE
jgi:two-component system OmpR family response regulator/two-component system response regulator CpxR